MDENTYRNQKMKGLVIFILIVLVHFGLSALVVPATLAVAGAPSYEQSEPGLTFKALVLATKVLHYPIIAKSLYSRHWFPGEWIYIPIFINSLLWATGIFSLRWAYKKIKEKKTNGKRTH